MSHATTMVTPHCHLPGRLLNKTDLDYSVWRSGILFCHLHEIGARGRRLHAQQHFNTISACSSWPRREHQPQNGFKKVWLIRQPQSGYDSGSRFILFVCNTYGRKKALHRPRVLMNEATHGSGAGKRHEPITRRKMSQRNRILF